jgi:NADH:ubiquinone oxidoreductase subunit 6 (subunit J)
MDISPIFFYIFAGLAIACSLMVVFKRNPVASAFSLVLVFFAFAGIFRSWSMPVRSWFCSFSSSCS